MLQYRFPEIYPYAVELVEEGIMGRKMAATILGQKAVHDLKGKDLMLGRECVSFIEGLLWTEQNPEVITYAISALAHLAEFDVLRIILPYTYHPDPNIRLEVAMSLGYFIEDEAIDALIELSGDQDYDTRNWATSGLRRSKVDNPRLRDALYARFTEKDDTIRGEALVGLTERLDPRVIVQLTDEIPVYLRDALSDSYFVWEAAQILLKRRQELGLNWAGLMAIIDESIPEDEDYGRLKFV